jgi:hypothetical protein
LLFLCVLWGASAGTYYVGPNGSSANNGLTASSPWPLDYAITHVPAHNTILLLPGNYTYSSDHTIKTPYLTFTCSPKWSAVITKVTTYHPFIVDYPAHDVVFDGLSFQNNQYDLVLGYGVSGVSNCVARNLWCRNTGNGFPASSSASGIEAVGQNMVVENCLLEWNGTNHIGFNHGIYAGGKGGIFRNNVCRYNGGAGIIINGHGIVYDDQNRVYNNLLYKNSSQGYQLAIKADAAGNSGSHYAYGNTIIEPANSYGVFCEQNTTVFLTNNIIVTPSAGGIYRASGVKVYADYNLAPSALSFPGAHDVVTSNPGFVNAATGLYWLRSDSAARVKALSTVYGPVDFFGKSQSAANDIGAFQYNAAYASDSRGLDPSPATPDYWVSLAGTNTGSAAITVTPANQDFGSIQLGTTADRTFSVQNTGSASLSGTASVPMPFSIVSGSPYTLGPGQTQAVTVRYNPTLAGTDVKTVTFSGANGASVTVSGSATTPPVAGSLSFPAPSGTITAPFTVNNGSLYQATTTTVVVSGGKAVYNFTTTNSGQYAIQALVNAPDTAANSFYVNIDGQPTDPTMIWDIPITTGFQQRIVNWRGNGTDANSQFVPALFNLTAGAHQLIIVGREANTGLQQVSLVQVPASPQNLHILAGP